ncbi:MAG TPA: nicotinate phosphoribosyltransferase [Chitinophagaceae bacterium]|nr:nicotinate phosphoribosyltransferase [Chitinophagaceae bacterium]
MQNNLILLADAYKYSHHKLYTPGTQKVYSYLESRGGMFDETAFFGLQYILKKYLQGAVITKEKIEEAAYYLNSIFGRDDVFAPGNFEYIVKNYGGRLPVTIKAVAEGTRIPVHNVLMTIENNDPHCYWLTNFLETLLMQVWYPTTVATLSAKIKEAVSMYYKETASDESWAGIDFVLNDFGFRGVSSVESAGIGGMAHLLSFKGSDTVIANVFAKEFYNAAAVPGASVPATEHSVMTMRGEVGEIEMFKHVLQTYPTGIVACVSDSYNIFRACADYWGSELKDIVLNRKGTLVIRPDSGDPGQTLLSVFDILFEKFGYTINEKGYRVLPPQVRVIQGDGVDYRSILHIYQVLKINGVSAENLVLGMGGALLQKVDRDTQKFALKCSYAEINGAPVDVRKNPVELNAQGEIEPSFKQSKAGRLKLVKNNGLYQTLREDESAGLADELVTVFENGEIIKEYGWEEVRGRINDNINH